MEMNQQEYDLIHRMITESGKMWYGSLNRPQSGEPVVICQRPSRAFYLTWIGNVEGNVNGWGIQLQPLEMDHAREFFFAFGSHYYYWIGVVMHDGKFRLRAYIKNGRRSDWTISIESCA